MGVRRGPGGPPYENAGGAPSFIRTATRTEHRFRRLGLCMVVHRGGFRCLHVLDFRHPLCRIVHWRGVFRCGAGGPFAQAGGELGERRGGFFEDGQRGSEADGGRGFGIRQDRTDGGKGVGGHLVGLVAPENRLIEASEFERLAENGRTKPISDGVAMHTRFTCGGGDGGPG